MENQNANSDVGGRERELSQKLFLYFGVREFRDLYMMSGFLTGSRALVTEIKREREKAVTKFSIQIRERERGRRSCVGPRVDTFGCMYTDTVTCVG